MLTIPLPPKEREREKRACYYLDVLPTATFRCKLLVCNLTENLLTSDKTGLCAMKTQQKENERKTCDSQGGKDKISQ